ncbi:hypothetical protein H5410_041558 [Solanum commersonii]|uniref:Uncharacterized protein n=1 Tax=Solanum commersonii TaxID=4109 RepID=A0A9J5XUX1_SOLCO|nr:hypothetical protein H5410_041558 [Solanum commersonii]
MARYLDTISYTTTIYKYRMHYEIILSSTGCEFQHFYPANTKKVYSFSKMIIKRLIAPEEWGMSTLKELNYIHLEQKVAVKYNYWDYIDGFNKVLLYENANRKHSWFIKTCSNIFDRNIPNWFCKWWTLYGPSEENIFFEGISLMYFFIEFSIPWIMKWSIEVNNTSEGFPCLQRTFYTKFWSKLLQKNPEGKLHGQKIIDLINVKISKYYDTATMEPQGMEDVSPFKRITRKLQIKKGLISKSEAIAIYMEEVKKDLMKNLDLDIKDDISMISVSHTNEEDDTCVVGEGQDVDEEEIDIETILKRYQQLEESSSTTLYRDIYRFMHIGLVQVAFKPLTLRGLPKSFIAALRDDRNHNWKKSLIGTIQTSLAYGPLNDGTVKIRFHEPTNMLIDNRSMSPRMTRTNSSYISPVDYIVQVPSRAFTSQIRETYGCDNIKIDKDNIARPIHRASSDLDIPESEMNFSDGITARIAKDFERKKWKLFRKWFFNNFTKVEQHDFQEEFYKDLIDSGINRLIAFVPWFMCKHVYNYISMLGRDFTLKKKFKGGGVQPINAENFDKGEPSNKEEFYDNLIRYQKNMLGNLSKEYRYTNRQIYTTVHRMLMYNTICKTNKNSDKTIADMITIGFTGQLKGWWDNYLNQEQRDKVLLAVKQEGEQFTQNAVYTLVLSIIEHFSGRWSDNNETIRTLLQKLRCKTLTSFRYYKDVFLCRVMKLLECNSTHWKSKFIDELPTLFAERVRKAIRGDNHSINYDNYTYGKLISTCVQEGLSLCNEIKLNQQIKRHRLNERKQLGEFCE